MRAAPTPRAGTYSRSSLHWEEWKIYIKSSEKSTTHPWGGGARTCVRFKRAIAAPASASLDFIIGLLLGACRYRHATRLQRSWCNLAPPRVLRLSPARSPPAAELLHTLCRERRRYNFQTFSCSLEKLSTKINMLKPDPTPGNEEKILKIKKIFVLQLCKHL